MNRIALLASTALCACFLTTSPLLAQQTIDIPSQPLAEALKELGSETGLQVLAPTYAVAGKTSKAVKGSMFPTEALQEMLSGTGLSFRMPEQNAAILSFGDVVSQNAVVDEDAFDLGTVIVTTARRTVEAVSDIPGNVVVLDQDFLDDSNITDFTDATEFLPNTNVGTNSDPRRGEFSIRGISNLNIAATSPTIGVFQNGVLQNGTGLRFNINPTLRDLERVEVLYGPQGTAYGRGTIGGAINYVTAKPVFEQEASLKLDYNDLDEVDAEFVFNTPLSDTVALRGVLYGNDFPGFIDAPIAPETSSIGSDNLGGRLSLRWQPSDAFTLDASIQYDESSYDGSFAATEESVLAGNPVQLSNTVPGVDIERTNYLLDARYSTEFGTFISTTGFIESTLNGTEDFDLGVDDNSVLVRDNFEDTFSQELRFESRDFDAGTGSLSFNVGVNYSETSAETQQDFRTNDFFTQGPGTSNAIFTRDVENYGIFGDIRWRPTDRLEIAAGARYSDDSVKVRSQAVTTGSIAALIPSDDEVLKASFSGFTPNVSVLYDWTETFSTYASFSTGYKPGGFAIQPGVGLTQFEEENAKNYEIGFRSSFFDNTVTVAGSIFRLDYEDIQVPLRIDPPNGFFGGVDNAAEARSEGFELSVSANPLPGLFIGGNYGYTDARFTDYADGPDGNLTGTQLPNAPDHTYSLVVDYEFANEIYGQTPFVRGEFSGRADFQSDPGGMSDAIGDYNLFNLRAGIRGENLRVTLYVENLFDEIYGVDAFGGNLIPGRPRTFGIVGTVSF